MCLVVLSDDEATTGLFIEPMDNAGPFLPADARERRETIKQRIHECVIAMTGARVDDESGRLVNDNQVIVLKQDLDRNWLRLTADLFRGGSVRLTRSPARTRSRGRAALPFSLTNLARINCWRRDRENPDSSAARN